MTNTLPLLLADLDNTIYNWVDFFAPSFRAMVHVLSREMELEEDTILGDFKAVYKEKGSLEYAFSVQELPSVRSRTPDEIARLVKLAKGAFSRVRDANLKPYAGVKQTLDWALNEGIRIVAVTNSPIHQAEQRLRHLHLDGCISGLAAWKGHDIPMNLPLTGEIRERAAQGKYRSRVKTLWHLRENELKPSPSGYLRVMEAVGADPESTYVIGDSLAKDLRPAVQVGAIAIWARYGNEMQQKNFDTLLRITHWSADKVATVYDEQALKPTFSIDSFSEIQQIIRTPQVRLFLL